MNPKCENPDVLAKYMNYPDELQPKLLALRALVFETAASTDDIGEIEEALKWGQPSFLTRNPKSGTTIRLHQINEDGDFGVFVSCQSNLIEPFRLQHPDLTYDGNRGILFERDQSLPTDSLREFFQNAMLYHKKK